MSDWDLLITDARIATMRGDEAAYGALENAAVANAVLVLEDASTDII